MSSEARTNLTEPELDFLLERLCVDLGFCFQGDKAESFYLLTPTSIQKFTDAVFDASGIFSQEAKATLYPQVRAVVAKAFGAQQTIPADRPKMGSG